MRLLQPRDTFAQALGVREALRKRKGRGLVYFHVFPHHPPYGLFNIDRIVEMVEKGSMHGSVWFVIVYVSPWDGRSWKSGVGSERPES